MQVPMILEFPASYCHLARGIMQVYLPYFYIKWVSFIKYDTVRQHEFNNSSYSLKLNLVSFLDYLTCDNEWEILTNESLVCDGFSHCSDRSDESSDCCK